MSVDMLLYTILAEGEDGLGPWVVVRPHGGEGDSEVTLARLSDDECAHLDRAGCPEPRVGASFYAEPAGYGEEPLWDTVCVKPPGEDPFPYGRPCPHDDDYDNESDCALCLTKRLLRGELEQYFKENFSFVNTPAEEQPVLNAARIIDARMRAVSSSAPGEAGRQAEQHG